MPKMRFDLEIRCLTTQNFINYTTVWANWNPKTEATRVQK